MEGLILAALLQTAATAVPDIPPGGKVVPPAWLAHPSSEAVFRAYPKDALARGMSGRAVIQCTVTAEGKLADCQVIEERPAGKGFGEAALSLAPYFLMRPMTVDGQPMPGGKISIPIQFKQSP